MSKSNAKLLSVFPLKSTGETLESSLLRHILKKRKCQK